MSVSQINLRQINVVAAAIQRSSDGRYLLARRKSGEVGAGLWEFPGGKIEPEETEQTALVREIQEELGLQLGETSLQFVARHVYDYPQLRVHLSLWRSIVSEPIDVKLIDHDMIDWKLPSELLRSEQFLLELSPADHYFLAFL